VKGPSCREGNRGEIKPRAQPANAAARADEISLRPLVLVFYVVVLHFVVYILVVVVPHLAR